MLTKRDKAAAKAYLRETPAIDRAQARVTSGDLAPGPYRILPLLGWLQKMGPQDYLALSMACCSWDDQLKGSLAWALPITPRTEPEVVRLLATMGWDGRIWPHDPGWPNGVGGEEVSLRKLLEASTVINTLVFPPTSRGSFALNIKVMNRTEAFPLSPAIEVEVPEEVQVSLRAKLRDLLAESASLF